jgi:hypothetical protein
MLVVETIACVGGHPRNRSFRWPTDRSSSGFIACFRLR